MTIVLDKFPNEAKYYSIVSPKEVVCICNSLRDFNFFFFFFCCSFVFVFVCEAMTAPDEE